MGIDCHNTDHYEDPQRPGWCAECRCAYPCPATVTPAEARRIAAQFRDERL